MFSKPEPFGICSVKMHIHKVNVFAQETMRWHCRTSLLHSTLHLPCRGGRFLSGSTLPSCGRKNKTYKIPSEPSFCQKHVNAHAWVDNGKYENATHSERKQHRSKCKMQNAKKKTDQTLNVKENCGQPVRKKTQDNRHVKSRQACCLYSP